MNNNKKKKKGFWSDEAKSFCRKMVYGFDKGIEKGIVEVLEEEFGKKKAVQKKDIETKPDNKKINKILFRVSE